MGSMAISRSAESAAQSAYRVRLDWGASGLSVHASRVDILVVVDVLSFGTCVDVALARGVTVYPWGGSPAAARQFARRRQARVVGSRKEPGDDGLCLSPAMLQACQAGEALVLPSLNGSPLAREAARGSKPVFAACLRNAPAVGRHLAAAEGSIGVIATGERWPDGSLRPAVEDLVGAGAVIAALEDPNASPEARAALAAFRGVTQDIDHALADCVSGRELIESGFAADVSLAAALDASACVPLLSGLAFEDAARRHP